MQQLILAGVLLALAAAARADDFTSAMTAEERTAAGLDKLSPEELARLKAAVERYKSAEASALVAAEVAVAQERAEEKVTRLEAAAAQRVAAAEQEARTKVAAALEQAKQAEEAAPAGRKQPGWLSALVTLQKVAEKPEAEEAMESAIAGDFRGWRRGTILTLENGQRWQVDESGEYVTPVRSAPKVRVRPGMLGAYWMEIEGVKLKVKVRPHQL